MSHTFVIESFNTPWAR